MGQAAAVANVGVHPGRNPAASRQPDLPPRRGSLELAARAKRAVPAAAPADKRELAGIRGFELRLAETAGSQFRAVGPFI